MLYLLKYRGVLKSEPQTAFLEVRPKATREEEDRAADAVGKRFCELEPGRKFIRAFRAIVADETILPDYAEEPVASKGGKGGGKVAPAKDAA